MKNVRMENNIAWIDKINKGISTALKSARKPLQSIPTILMLCDIMQRPGLSAISLSSSIISRLPEIGIKTDPNADGSDNMINGFVKIMCEEFIREIHENGVIHGAMEPGSINFNGTGANAGGPVNVTGTNINVAKLYGLMR